jgi:UDP-N-acetylglucosamine/UDP-N-acetylgalactosamine diphosphorylase
MTQECVLMATYAEIAPRLERIGQAHLLRFYPELPADRQRVLLERIAAIDLESLPRWIEEYVKRRPAVEIPAGLEPAPYYPHDPRAGGRAWDPAEYRRVGETLLREGKVAAFTVAGGQGSRLGFEGPKGMYPAGAVTGKPLFQIFAEGLLAAGRKYGQPAPWYIMTSPLNHDATVEFFERSRFFGLDREDVMFFPQGVMPSFEMGTGRVLLAAKDEPATNPDGHGGSIKALWASGAIADMKRRGVEHISYFQVDNPIVRVVDPVFLGLHAAAPDSSAQMSSKMIPKTGPEEKVGVFCAAGGRTLVVEYSDLPRELAEARRPDGGLKFNAGSIAVHILSVAFVEAMNTDRGFELPFHRADKRVPHVDLATGALVQPAQANGVKLERFVFDALPLCRGSIVYETERAEEFAPIKNATGVDSVESSHRIQTERAARWLEAAGARVPRKAEGSADCVLEVSPLTALEAGDLRGRALPEVRPGSRAVI